MSWVMVDVEADLSACPVPGGASRMTELGAVLCKDPTKTFYYKFEAGDHTDNGIGMDKFAKWLKDNCEGSPRFISDNNGFDWGWVNYYFWIYTGTNPFGHSSTNLGSLYKGMKKAMRQSFKHLRVTKHTHHPVDDAMGNVEALLYMVNKMGLEMEL